MVENRKSGEFIAEQFLNQNKSVALNADLLSFLIENEII